MVKLSWVMVLSNDLGRFRVENFEGFCDMYRFISEWVCGFEVVNY